MLQMSTALSGRIYVETYSAGFQPASFYFEVSAGQGGGEVHFNNN